MKLKTFITMGLLSMLGLGSCNAQQKDNTAKQELSYTMDKNAQRHSYFLLTVTKGCSFRVLLNDIPIKEHFAGWSFDGELFLNQFIAKSGIQKLKIEFYPVKGHEENSFDDERPIHLEVRKFIKGDTPDLLDYDTISINPIPKIEKGTTHYVYETEFHADVPYNIPILDECIRLDTIPNIEELVKEQYNELKTLYEKRKYAQFLQKFDISRQRIAVANYYREGRMEKENKWVIDAMKEAYKKVAPIENYKLLFYGNGKLVTLTDKTDSLATFRLDDGGDSFWPVTFYLGKRKSSDKLEILFEE